MFEDVIAKMNQEAVRNEVSSGDDKRTYTVDEIQDILGICRTSAYSLVKQNLFHCVRIGGRIRVSKKALMNGWMHWPEYVKDVAGTFFSWRHP